LTWVNARPYLLRHQRARANADQKEPVMTSFTFSLEQLKAAPPEVRRWVEHEVGAALGFLGRLDHDLRRSIPPPWRLAHPTKRCRYSS
jgi:hypothetical protein